jgi:hypothetical protein
MWNRQFRCLTVQPVQPLPASPAHSGLIPLPHPFAIGIIFTLARSREAGVKLRMPAWRPSSRSRVRIGPVAHGGTRRARASPSRKRPLCLLGDGRSSVASIRPLIVTVACAAGGPSC